MTESDGRVTNTMDGVQGAALVVQAGSIGTLGLPPVPAPPVLVPRQLPAGPAVFVNRRAELEALERLLTRRGDQPAVVVLSGLGGVGKTGLGLHWARAAGPRFDGGQLYADLAALRHRGGVDVGDVLGDFLRALGAKEDAIPAGLEQRASLYRTMAAGRRLLVVLDNVEHAAQVTPLIPGSAGAAVVVISRRRLTGLLVAGAVPVRLDPLDGPQGVRLIREMLADSRVDEEPEAAGEVARLCGGLPIALRVCAARLVGRSGQGIGRLSAALADEERRLERLTAEGVPIVEAVFDAAYAGLPAEAAALYRGLGAHPGPEFSPDAVGAITGRGPDASAGTVEVLLEASLLEEVGADRYRFHDLVRLHARARAREAGETGRPIVEWYLARAKAADRAALGRRLRLADDPGEGAGSEEGAGPPAGEGPVFERPADAAGWLERERANLLAAVRLAADEGWDALVWQFGEALWALYDNRAHLADELEVARLGVAAARRCGNRPAEARMHNQVVRALLRAGELDAAAEAVPVALEAAAECGHHRVESAVIESAGLVRLRRGDHDAAIAAFRRSREINAAAGNRRGVAMQTYHLGTALGEAGRYAAAAGELARAMAGMVEIGDELSQAKVGIRLGAVLPRLDRPAEAVDALGRALAILAVRDEPRREATALELLADLQPDPEEAGRYRRRARSLRGVLPETGA